MKTTHLVSAVLLSALTAAPVLAGGLTKQSCGILETALRGDYSNSQESKSFAEREKRLADSDLLARNEKVADARNRVLSALSDEVRGLIRSYRDGQYDNLNSIIDRAEAELAPVRGAFPVSCPKGTAYTDYNVTDGLVGCSGELTTSYRPASDCLTPDQVASAKKNGGIPYYETVVRATRNPEITKLSRPRSWSFETLVSGRKSMEERMKYSQICLPEGSLDKYVTDHWGIKNARQLREQTLREATLSLHSSRGKDANVYYWSSISLLDLLTPPKKAKTAQDIFEEQNPRIGVQSEDEYVRTKLPAGCPKPKLQIASDKENGTPLKTVTLTSASSAPAAKATVTSVR